METVTLHNSSPLVTFRLLFNAGSVFDPKGKEGIAALTAAMLSEGGSRSMSYDEIVRAMYPMATSFSAQVDKEITVFCGTTHIDNLESYYRIISDMLLDPGWREEDLTRLREDAINYIRVNLRRNNDEELGKEALYSFIFEGHPYKHLSVGTVESLERMTLDDIKDFYREHYSGARFVSGLAGGIPKEFEKRLSEDFTSRLPASDYADLALAQPAQINGFEIKVIKKATRGTAISFGYPIQLTRSHDDWPALLVAQSYLGQHRSSNSRLYQRLRQIRGLNYGDYAYIEYFPRGMFQFHPDPNLGRRQQIFEVWVRPVEPENGLFALRAALYELRKLIERGLSPEDFEATRLYLSKFVNVLTGTQDAQLGYALDSRYYGLPDFNQYLRERLSRLTRDDVNRSIRTYLQARDIKIVVVTEDAEGFLNAALKNEPSPITYETPMPDEILEEDRIIESYALNLNPSSSGVVPVDDVFQR
ncbi:MAG TPA: pitrilysin family protein [Blastocatellia bacterium]|nr:pitrilysin family protein [Blastocatellia bacterium]